MYTYKKTVSLCIGLAIFFLSMGMVAQPAIGDHTGAEVTFADDIAPILYENCVKCHRPGGVGPMSLVTYEEVQPWAPLIMHKTQLRDRMGAMPPYYLERGIGIQQVKDDERLSEEQIEMIASWAEHNAPMGLRENIPPPPEFDDSNAWKLGTPDLVVALDDVTVKAGASDSWIAGDLVPIGLTEDRYVSAVEMREVNNADPAAAGATVVGGLYIFHHMSWATVEAEEDIANRDLEQLNWPVHELGRNPDIFDPKAGRILKAGSSVMPTTYHLHSNGQDTTGHMELGFYFHPKGYEPEHKRGRMSLGDGMNISVQGNMKDQELHTYTVLQEHTKISSFEPHLHGPGARMCLEAIWGNQIETLACSGYDHNWVKQYTFEDDYAPLLPKGTIVHMIGYMDNTTANSNVADARNWSGSGNASITNMFLHLGQSVTLTDQQFVQEMAERRERLGLTANDHIIGCPLCLADLLPLPDMSDSADRGE